MIKKNPPFLAPRSLNSSPPSSPPPAKRGEEKGGGRPHTNLGSSILAVILFVGFLGLLGDAGHSFAAGEAGVMFHTVDMESDIEVTTKASPSEIQKDFNQALQQMVVMATTESLLSFIRTRDDFDDTHEIGAMAATLMVKEKAAGKYSAEWNLSFQYSEGEEISHKSEFEFSPEEVSRVFSMQEVKGFLDSFWNDLVEKTRDLKEPWQDSFRGSFHQYLKDNALSVLAQNQILLDKIVKDYPESKKKFLQEMRDKSLQEVKTKYSREEKKAETYDAGPLKRPVEETPKSKPPLPQEALPKTKNFSPPPPSFSPLPQKSEPVTPPAPGIKPLDNIKKEELPKPVPSPPKEITRSLPLVEKLLPQVQIKEEKIKTPPAVLPAAPKVNEKALPVKNPQKPKEQPPAQVPWNQPPAKPAVSAEPIKAKPVPKPKPVPLKQKDLKVSPPVSKVKEVIRMPEPLPTEPWASFQEDRIPEIPVSVKNSQESRSVYDQDTFLDLTDDTSDAVTLVGDEFFSGQVTEMKGDVFQPASPSQDFNHGSYKKT